MRNRLPMDMPASDHVVTDRGRFHYMLWNGTGSDVHFAHANGFCAGTYAPLLNRLADRVRVVASDFRGHGDSDGFDNRPLDCWESFADDLIGVVEAVLDPPVIGIGHSLGAVSTLMAAARRPDLFSRLVLVDPVIFHPLFLAGFGLMLMLGQTHRMPLARGARRRKRRFAGREAAGKRFHAGRGMFRTWRPEFIDAYLACAFTPTLDGGVELKCDPETEARIYETVPLNIWSYPARVKCPVLSIRGRYSGAFRPESQARLTRKLAAGKAVLLPDAGHFVPMERPDAVARHIFEFIE